MSLRFWHTHAKNNSELKTVYHKYDSNTTGIRRAKSYDSAARNSIRDPNHLGRMRCLRSDARVKGCGFSIVIPTIARGALIQHVHFGMDHVWK